MILRFLLPLLAFLISPAPLLAQYRVHTWESFESGLSPDLILGHGALESKEATILPFDYQGAEGAAFLTSGIARLECASKGALFKPSVEHRTLSFVTSTSLDRRLLGERGRALYQVDVFLPELGAPFPNTALLAVVVDTASKKPTYRMYRFGIAGGGERLYFSYANDQVNGAPGEPVIYLKQPLAELKLKRPGWHRLQLILHGQEEIVCAVDLLPTSFSPLKEGTLGVLNAGIMVASKHGTDSVLIDNASIQWTFEDVPLPDSPWRSALPNADAPNTNLMESGSSVFWLTDPQKAWKLASAQKRPILAQFHAPHLPTYTRLKEITPNDEQTKALLNRFVLLKVDVNQLGGGVLAQKFGIVRVPTFLVMGPDGRERKRIPLAGTQSKWNQLKEELVSALPRPDSDQQASSAPHAGH